MPKSPEEMAESMIKNMKEKTGKTLEEWLPIARAAGIEKQRALLNHLKNEYGVTYGFANLIAMKALQKDDAPVGDDLVTAQYAGPKAGLKPIYDALIAHVKTFGDDVELAPKKAYVSLRRNKQFAIIQPSTKTRVDVGINMKDADAGERLEASGSFNSMVSHRVRLSNADEVDAELTGWLKAAYDKA